MDPSDPTADALLALHPAWLDRLPADAMPRPGQVLPPPRKNQTLPNEGRWRMVTAARLYGLSGWTLARIGKHFGVQEERARQLVRAGGYWGERGRMTSPDPAVWQKQRDF